MSTQIRERMERWRSFVAGQDRCPFMFHVNFPLPEWESQLPPPVPLWPERAKERIERRWAEYQLMCRKAGLVDDDRVPYLSNVQAS